MMAKTKPEPSRPDAIGEFRTLSEKTLNKLIDKGRQAAEELDKVLRSQFELSDADGSLRLR